MYADLVDSETGRRIGGIREEILPRKGEVVLLKRGKSVNRCVVENVEWSYEVNTLYPKDSLIFHHPKILLSFIVIIPKHEEHNSLLEKQKKK